MGQRIERVLPGIGKELGLRQGDEIISIRGETIADVVDYEALCSEEEFSMLVKRADGSMIEAYVEKEPWEHMGLEFENGLMSKSRSCANNCVFCFVDQLPAHLRESLRFKDDDWRLSFIMGNFITLTNVGEREFERILRRKAGPLYISVHATQHELREKMLGTAHVPIMQRLQQLKDVGISFHCQAVLCPGLNDGAHLDRTISDLLSLYPAARSLAVVPVGLTGHRQGLYPLKAYSRQGAGNVVRQVTDWQRKALKLGTRFVFAADEFYLTGGLKCPSYDDYEEFPQLENGVGLMTKFLYEVERTLMKADRPKGGDRRQYTLVTGEAAQGFMREICEKMQPLGADITVRAVKNRIFGGSVDVAGLVCGGDILHTLESESEKSAPVLIPACMLRSERDMFLDSMTVTKLSALLGRKIIICEVDGYDFVRAVSGSGEEKAI
ncbi:MAG: DUF512 domain-containing protein [Christensenellales bacterium]|jgi:putative radical SAM enzyme (TIGR03279 family)